MMVWDGLTDTSVYSPNILLYDPHNTHLLVRGKNIYLAIAKLIKWSSVWYFDDISLDIVKIHVTQNGGGDYDDKNNLENGDGIVNAYFNQDNLDDDDCYYDYYYYLNDNESIDSLNVINNSYE